MRKYSNTFGPPFYTFFHGKNAMHALQAMRKENQKIMDVYVAEHMDTDIEPQFWRVVTGLSEGEGATLLCILE